ncbi:MAG: MFS transporter [Cyclobacteriaceae bacterium]
MAISKGSGKQKFILPIIIFSQFAGTSLWFAGNAVLPDLIDTYGFSPEDLGAITSAVQFGFILGTLIFALLMVADSYSPSKVFFACSALGSFINLVPLFVPITLELMLPQRAFVGFLLAGIYPVGMKIAADWHQKSLGKALGFLVGALVLGTGFPHLIKYLGAGLQFEKVLVAISILSFIGGLLILVFVPNGPYRKQGSKFKINAIKVLFNNKKLKWAAMGYFGHMWELYTFWALVPLIISIYSEMELGNPTVSLISFCAISVGFLGCAVGGLLALKKGSGKVAFSQLLGSAICICLTPAIMWMPEVIFYPYLLIWGVLVIGDSPQFSTLAAKSAPPELVGSALTLMNSIGFALTIPSILLLNYLFATYNHPAVLLALLPGPIIGLVNTRQLLLRRPS